MPYLYAIAETLYEDGIPPEEGDWKDYHLVYHPVTEEIAEVHEEGCFKLVNNAGQDMTRWSWFYPELRAADTTKVGTGKPLKDAIGTDLVAGDFVMVSRGKSTTLKIQEVVGFTPQKIRVREVRGIGSGDTKFPREVIKIDKSNFF
jgi:hypothetical protein